MKVIVDCVGVRDGGGARLLSLFVKHLCVCRPQWEFLFCILPEDERDFIQPDIPSNAKILEISMSFGWISRFYWLSKHLPILANQYNADLLFSFANLPPARPTVPTVLFVQQMKALLPQRKGGLRERLRLWLLNRYLFGKAHLACRIIVQSEQMRNLFIQYAPQLTDRVKVIQSPIETNKQSTASSEIIGVLNKASSPRIAYISLPRLHKNHINLIRAFSLVHKRIPTASLLLTVPAPSIETSDAVVGEIHNEVRSLKISNAIVWLGNLPSADVAAVYNNVDVTVFPSLKESFGMPLAESLCALCPVIASDLPFAHEILGNAGVYFDPTQPNEIARVILETLRSPKKMEAMCSVANERRWQFDPARVAEQFCLLFEGVVNERVAV